MGRYGHYEFVESLKLRKPSEIGYGHDEFVKSLKYIKEPSNLKTSTMDEISLLMESNKYYSVENFEEILEKYIDEMKKRKINFHVIKLDEEADDLFENICPMEDWCIRDVLEMCEGEILMIELKGKLVKLRLFNLYESAREKYQYIQICLQGEKQKSEIEPEQISDEQR